MPTALARIIFRHGEGSGVLTRNVPSMQVLVVEDDPDIADVVRIVLQLRGHRCQTAASGAAALAAAAAHCPDVVFVDLGLPDMGGVDVAHRLRMERSDAPLYVVALTGLTAPSDDAALLAATFDEYLVKPVEHAVLADTVTRAWERRQLPARRA